MKYAIIGCGAVGIYYGGRLAEAGNEVHFLFNSDYDFVKQNGLNIKSVNGDFVLTDINAYKDSSQMPKCDVIIVCLKTTNNNLLNNILPPILHKNSIVILIQNGLNLEQELTQSFPNIGIIGGMAFICSNKIGKGAINHLDYGKLTLGVFQNVSEDIFSEICSDFENAGVPIEKSDNLLHSRWKKLVWNIPYNGMTVVLNSSTDALMNNPSSRQLIYDLMLEVIEAANYCGANIEKEFADQMMVYTDNMRPYNPSMKLDFDFARPLEIRAIYSNPIKSAKENGFIMKKTQVIEQQLSFINQKNLEKRGNI